ncbi:MAG: hypothetical protein D6807_06975 [Alphaproteobacteria bacterium]|nr:MAG: hypothetical protein D6807_06975 [Alphaproteobacteria bacterium]
MEHVQYKKGEVIYREGDPGDAIFVLEEGAVAVSREVSGRQVRLAVIGKGEIFGESGVILGKPRSTTMTALSPVSALKVDRPQFLQVFSEDNPIGLPLLRMLCTRLEKADRRMLDIEDDTREKASLARLESVRIFGESPLVAKQVGERGARVRQFPFRIGRVMTANRPPSIRPDGLALFPGNDASLSPEHLALEKRDGYLIVRDLGSYLGTLANGRYLSRFSQEATAPLYFGVNEVIAGTADSPFRFRIVIEPRGSGGTAP